MTSDLLKAEVTPQEPGSGLVLNGKTYRITFPMSAVIRYKQKTGDSLFNIAHVIRIDKDPELLIAALWAGLQEHQPETKYEDVEKLVNVGTAVFVSVAVAAALKSYLPSEVKDRVEADDPNVVSPPATTA